MSTLLELISDLDINTQQRRDLAGWLCHLVANQLIEQVILRFRDPVVRKVVHGAELFLPLSHQLPRFAARFPYYDTVLPNLTKFLLEGHSSDRNFVLVDVGANVGDTAKLVSAATGGANLTFICIEPDEAYLPLLRRNTQGLPVAVHHVIAASRTGEMSAGLSRSGSGTSSVIEGTERRNSVTLDDLLSDQPVDLIKIDTDGFEAEVLRGASRILEHSAPLIFIEFSPRHLRGVGKVEPSSILEMLRSSGYDHGIVYDNRGYPMALTQFTDAAIRYLVNYCLAAPGLYADILLGKDQSMLAQFYDWDVQRYSR